MVSVNILTMSENSQDETMGNQQERPAEGELGWLGGMLDGEGSLALTCNNTHRSIYPIISITTVDENIIKKCEEIIKKIGIEFGSVYYVPPRGKQRRSSHTIRVSTAKRVKSFLTVLKPYIFGKTHQVDFLIEWCSIRTSLPYAHPYTEREMFLFYEIKKYQIKKGKPSKTGIPIDYTPGWRPRYTRSYLESKSLHKI